MIKGQPLGLPAGSVRAIISLAFSIAVIVAVFIRDNETMKLLIPIATYTIGQYFGTRSSFNNGIIAEKKGGDM